MSRLAMFFRLAQRDRFYFEFFLAFVEMLFLIFGIVLLLPLQGVVFQRRIDFGNVLLRFRYEPKNRTYRVNAFLRNTGQNYLGGCLLIVKRGGLCFQNYSLSFETLIDETFYRLLAIAISLVLGDLIELLFLLHLSQ
jgi:hypothetical protein